VMKQAYFGVDSQPAVYQDATRACGRNSTSGTM
jgi:hypothetical protein